MDNSTNWTEDSCDCPEEREYAESVLAKPIVITMIVLCLLCFFANSFSILATSCIPRGQTTHSKLIISLAMSDVLVVVSVLFGYISEHLFPSPCRPDCLSPQHRERMGAACSVVFDRCFRTTALLATLLNLLAMAVDHNIAVMRPLHYPAIMSALHSNIMIICLWVLAVAGGFLDFIVGASSFTDGDDGLINLCEHVSDDFFDCDHVVQVLIFVTLFVMTCVYARIYTEVKRVQTRDHELQQDAMKNKKAIVTTLLILGTFGFCWLPYGLYTLGMRIAVENVPYTQIAAHHALFISLNNVAIVLLLSNTLWDPIIYAVRLRDVQMGYRNLFRKMFRRKRGSLERDLLRCRRNTTPIYLSSDEPAGRRSDIVDDAGTDLSAENLSNGTQLSPVSHTSLLARLNCDCQVDVTQETTFDMYS